MPVAGSQGLAAAGTMGKCGRGEGSAEEWEWESDWCEPIGGDADATRDADATAGW